MTRSRRKRRRKRRQKGIPPMPARMRKLAQAGYHVRAFEISDDVEDTYKPGITDEIVEATILLKRGCVDEAKATFQSIIEREPRAREAYTNLAAAYTMSGDEETAEALSREAMEMFPMYVLPRTNLAQIFLRRGQVDEAEKLLIPLDKLKKFTSSEFQFYALMWSDILAARGDYEAARSWLDMLSEVIPDAPGLRGRRIRYSLGRWLHR